MATTTAPAAPAANVTEPQVEPPRDDEVIEVEDEEDSAFGGSNSQSDWTSVTSSVYRGVVENGRRYQSFKEGEYWGPADEQQFESMAGNHLAHMLHDQHEENPYFRSPLSDKAQYILDVGTGGAEWAVDVADRFPNITVHGVDLHPPPQTWIPPNCVLEVDDVTKPWTWSHKFDLVHIRHMYGSFTDEQWSFVYDQAYKNTAPGGFIEQVELSIDLSCNDGSIPPDSVMGTWGPMMTACCAASGRRIDTNETMRASIERAGFKIVKEVNSKYPIGTWPKNPLMRELGRVQMAAGKTGLEGYAMHLLTHFGLPKPWTPEEVQVHLMQMRKDLDNKKYHPYSKMKRVWAQKPFEKKAETEDGQVASP